MITSNKTKWALLLFGIALTFQLILWVQTSDEFLFRNGNDEKDYTYIAYQMLGAIDSKPVFDVRPPGWPATIATLLGLFGIQNYWVIGLFQRVLLAFFPMLFFLILTNRPTKNYAVPALLSLAALALPINRTGPLLPLAEVLYTFLQLLSLFIISKLKVVKTNSNWLLMALSITLLYLAMVRIQAVLIYAVIAVAYFLFRFALQRNMAETLRASGIFIAPLLASLLLLGAYNKVQLGTFGLPTLANIPAYYFARSTDARDMIVPTSKEMSRLRDILPEVPLDRFPLSYWPNHFVAPYRAEVIYGISRLHFSATVMGPATQQYLAANWGEYLRFGIRWLFWDISAQPFPSSFKYDKLPEDEAMPTPDHSLALSGGKRNTKDMWDEYERIISMTEFSAFPEKQSAAPQWVATYMDVNSWNLHPGYLYAGPTGIISMIVFVYLARRQFLSYSLLLIYFGNILPAAFACGDCVTWGRFQYSYQLASMLALLLVLNHAINFLIGDSKIRLALHRSLGLHKKLRR